MDRSYVRFDLTVVSLSLNTLCSILTLYITYRSWDAYAASVSLPAVLYDPVKTKSSSDTDTAFNHQFKTPLSRWQWLEEPVVGENGAVMRKPELEIFGLAMVGGGRALGPPLYAGTSLPWQVPVSIIHLVNVRLPMGGPRLCYHC